MWEIYNTKGKNEKKPIKYKYMQRKYMMYDGSLIVVHLPIR